MARHVVNPNQLRLFVDPVEHQATIKDSTDVYSVDEWDTPHHSYSERKTSTGPSPAMGALWAQKEWEARQPAESYEHGSGLYDRIHSGEQVHTPIEVHLGESAAQDKQYEGHHRIAASAAVQRDTGRQQFVPVKYNTYGYSGIRLGTQTRKMIADVRGRQQGRSESFGAGAGAQGYGANTRAAASAVLKANKRATGTNTFFNRLLNRP